MSTSPIEKPSNEERKDIWVELQSFRQATLALRTEAYRLRTAGRLDATANERLHTQQTELERRGEAIVKRLSPEVEWPTGRGSVPQAGDESGMVS